MPIIDYPRNTGEGVDPFTPELLQEALRMRYDGAAWEKVSRDLGLPYDGLRRRLEPGYAAKRNRQIREARGHSVLYGAAPHRPTPREALRALASVPSDTRSLQARLMGDPLPGRSALDRRGAG